jgi:hypothetical protein
MNTLQSLNVYPADVHFGSGLDAETQIEHGRIRGLGCDGRIHLGEGVAPFLQRSQQPRASRKYRRGDRRLPGVECKCATHRIGQFTVNIDAV